jgi:hypothetical protein
MSSYKTQQHRLVHRGRTFHFVSYEGQAADEKHQQAAQPASWYLMLAGKRWMVSPQAATIDPAELDRQFASWLEAHVFTEAPAIRSQQPPPSPGPGAEPLLGRRL